MPCPHYAINKAEQYNRRRGLWGAGLAEYDETEGIEWEWQAIEGVMTKAPLARIIREQNEGCLSARGQGWPVVSASLRARYRCSASVAASSSAWR